MIAIVNIGPAPGNKRRGCAKDQPRDPLGEHLYQIKINAGPPLAVFTHARGDSLSTCLRKAADAYDAAHLKRLVQLSETSPHLNHESSGAFLPHRGPGAGVAR